jgi:hypothetical protein
MMPGAPIPQPRAELLYLWLKDGRWILTIVAGGKTSEFEIVPSMLRGMVSEAARALTT